MQEQREATETKKSQPPRLFVVDKGHAWVVLVSSLCNSTLTWGICNGIGVFYEIFIQIWPDDKAILAIAMSSLTAIAYILGPVSAIFCNFFGLRGTAILGGIISSLGLTLSSFSTDPYILYITFALMTGVGFGLSMIAHLGIINQYFSKYKTIAFAVCTSGFGVGKFIFPPFIKYLDETFGWRGTLLLCGGIVSHTIVFSALYFKNSKSCNKEVTEDNSKIFDKIFNIKLFKDIHFMIMLFNNFGFFVGYSVILLHIPSYATSLGFAGYMGTFLLSIIGIANFIGRILQLFTTRSKSLQNVGTYTLGYLIAGIVMVIFPSLTNYPELAICVFIYGIGSSVFMILPLLVTDLFDESLFSYAYGYIQAAEGVGIILGGPLAGWLYGETQWYPASFYFGGTTSIITTLPVILTWIHLNNKTKVLSEKEKENAVLEDEKQSETLPLIMH